MQTTESRRRATREYGTGTLLMARMCHACTFCPFKQRGADSASSEPRRRREPWCPGWTAHKRVYGSAPGTR